MHLRRPSKRDETEYLGLVRASVLFLGPWEPRHSGGPASPDRFLSLLRKNRAKHDLKMLVCRNEDGAIAGGMNINNIVQGVFQSASLGYWVGAAHARQGLMTEALQLALRHAFFVLKLHRVEANIMLRNKASLRLVRRAGFRKEGYSPRYLKIAGRWSDHERWALLSDEWKKPTASSRT